MENPSINFQFIPLTYRQTDVNDHITSLAEVAAAVGLTVRSTARDAASRNNTTK